MFTDYICHLCGYVYNPAQGDTAHGIDKGVQFTDLPDDWVCPVCHASKDAFSKA
ncbi:MAG: rubredoxin [Clostridia bacterium]|nr:rubredoxin [Clostridia bacterium]